MAKPKNNSGKVKRFDTKVKNRNKPNRASRAYHNIGARQSVGTACYKSEMMDYAMNEQMRLSAKLISGSLHERRRALERLQYLLKIS